MQIPQESLADVDRFLHRDMAEDASGIQFRSVMRLLENGAGLHAGPHTQLLEIGVGTGGFQIECARRGIPARGIEISPQLLAHTQQAGRAAGFELDVELANVETSDLGRERYDIIVAASVFEHVEDWRSALRHVFAALKPGGVFVFDSTNKFSFVSAEYPLFMYGWLPNRWRYRFRMARQGPEIMKLGIDFHQFTYPRLRREFRKAGFRKIVDRMQVAAPAAGWKRALVQFCRAVPPLNWLVLTFCDATVFVCVK